ncbi:MAG: hypothetical protein JSV94_00310 [Methanobacteriota archaeon]|nr:MAG: hypothetical protein JSV94_00310 [Euryarchaeota archaeon]
MPDKKCPMCDGTCVLKVIATKTAEAETVDICSLCGSIFRRDEEQEENKGEQ